MIRIKSIFWIVHLRGGLALYDGVYWIRFRMIALRVESIHCKTVQILARFGRKSLHAVFRCCLNKADHCIFLEFNVSLRGIKLDQKINILYNYTLTRLFELPLKTRNF